jgi:hypothetical protein
VHLFNSRNSLLHGDHRDRQDLLGDHLDLHHLDLLEIMASLAIADPLTLDTGDLRALRDRPATWGRADRFECLCFVCFCHEVKFAIPPMSCPVLHLCKQQLTSFFRSKVFHALRHFTNRFLANNTHCCDSSFQRSRHFGSLLSVSLLRNKLVNQKSSMMARMPERRGPTLVKEGGTIKNQYKNALNG